MTNEFVSILLSSPDFLLAALLSYPFVTSLLWSLSGLYYVLSRSLKRGNAVSARPLADYTVIIPFYAESDAALASARSLAAITPSPAEILIVDDGSPVPLPHDTELPPGARVLRLNRNRGKAGALQVALASVKTEVIVCLDADTQSKSLDWSTMLANFDDPKLGALTGKICPTSGGGIVEWFQALDYLTVIAVIKSAESAWGGLLTVSGAFTAYRTSALRSIGGWDNTSPTEDIDASWRLQTAGWRLAFESNWVARVEMAPNVGALWRQRRRWSSGLGRALRDHGINAITNGAQHLPIIILTLAGLTWLTSVLAFLVIAAPAALTSSETHVWFTPQSIATIFAMGLAAFYAQLATAMIVDGRNPVTHWRSALLAPLYPLYFWGILLTSFLAGFPKGLLRHGDGNWQRTVRRIEARGVS